MVPFVQRIDPHVVVRRMSPFQSSRNGARIQLITVHATESTEAHLSSRDLAAVGEWFCNPQAQASSHVCTDADGQSARYVADDRKAWHCAHYNSVSLGVEEIGWTEQRAWVRDEYRETARWVARWSLMYGVPIQHGQVADGAVVRPGVVRHSDLGQLGGGHGDPGSPYDLELMMGLARFYHGKLIARQHRHA